MVVDWKGRLLLHRFCYIGNWLITFVCERQLFRANAQKLSLSSILLVGSLILFDILTNQKDSLGDIYSEKVI